MGSRSGQAQHINTRGSGDFSGDLSPAITYDTTDQP